MSYHLTLSSIFFIVALSLARAQNIASYNVAITTKHVIDQSRLDPFAPNTTPRALMVSTFKRAGHACHLTKVPYMPSEVAKFEGKKLSAFGLPESTFMNLTYSICSNKKKSQTNDPILIFSGALGTTRFFYNLLAAKIAQKGYTVVTVDHPYDTDIVQFPNGRIIMGLNLSDDQISLAANTRSLDLNFVANLFMDKKQKKAGVLGHSLGGAAALNDLIWSKFIGSLNFDGSFFGDISQVGSHKPVLFFSHTGKNISTDTTWQSSWPRFTGWKKQVEIVGGSTHYTFSDIPLIATKLGADDGAIAQFSGTLKGDRVMEILSTYTDAFFSKFLKGSKNDTLLDGPTKDFPEVAFDF
ncbi:uncharacterized protein FA14DRAFT_88243 [Meira miltonrushii]|uniref:1-alkyl-2-acetylglycerophosphocholine esterase n=1 Tax=Meira miltonrushii TaxID=1280837 RepID=A0A316V4V3_9BASI|nr:uncharacterized protein FA14DRAFT_88243 [Meira miltonrushii]PWN31521.1 hypothetical protein FA14DRAFT_88243 [Meira miltonrushii]